MANPTTFDFIICGGGTAGLVLANRLSDNAAHSILVLEAGDDHAGDPLIETPGALTQLYGNPKYDWDFKTTPQPSNCEAVHSYPQGKGLGGSSAINLLNYSHCSRQDLDKWAALGNEGWGFDDLTPYMRRAETVHVPSKETSEAFGTEWIMPELRGQEGPVQLAFPGGDLTWAQKTVTAQGKAMGYPATKDPRGGSSLGVFNQYIAVDPKDWTRSHAANSYLEMARERPNLTVWINAMVMKVKFAETGKDEEPRAEGVVLEMAGMTHEVKASKEVILCLGSVRSPQMLELSGIGCPKLLSFRDVPVLVENRNVGENLQDHPLITQSWAVKADVLTAETFRDHPERLQQAMELYQAERKSFFSGAISGTGFLDLNRIAPGLDMEEYTKKSEKPPPTQEKMLLSQLKNPTEAVVQFHLGAMGFDTTERAALGPIFMHSVPGNYFTMLLSLCHPWSRGSIHIASADVRTPPIINPNFLGHALDIDIAAHGLLHLKQFINTAPIADYLQDDPDTDNGGKLPMPGYAKFDTVEEARESARAHIIPHFHPCGTCAMLPRDDGGVVNSALEVYWTKALRVVDASIFPMQVQGNIQSVVYAVAEKAADIIKAKYSEEQ